VYLVYSVGENFQSTTAVGRGVLNGNTLENFEELFRGEPLLSGGNHFGSRIIFDKDNKLYFSIGDRGRDNNAQDSTNHYGGVLRINDDGSIPEDNPYLNAPGAQPEIYTMGNRNIQGMFYLSEKDEIWAIEHGPQGGDELNLIEAGENYAWPLATFGINYDGTPITDKTSIPGYKDPITYWVPSIAPCGMDMINYDEATNELDIIFGALRGSHLHRIIVKDNKVTETVRSLQGYARFRDVQMSPDGYLYAATQGPGRIIRLKIKD
jgi:glucose/arabinose dehydrogenase